MRTSPGVNGLRVWPLSLQIQSVLLSVRCPVSFEHTSGRPGHDAKANQRRKRGPDADVRRRFASRGPAHATRNDRAADVARGPNVAEHAIEFMPQVDEGFQGHTLLPSRSQPFDHLWKPDALGVTLRHGAPFYGGVCPSLSVTDNFTGISSLRCYTFSTAVCISDRIGAARSVPSAASGPRASLGWTV